MHWYDDLPHIGYDMDGKKVLKPARGDELDKFLSTVDDPSSWCVLPLFLLPTPPSCSSGPQPSIRTCRWIDH